MSRERSPSIASNGRTSVVPITEPRNGKLLQQVEPPNTVSKDTIPNGILPREPSDASLRDFIEAAAFAMHSVSADGTILWANQAELDLLGYRREEYVGHNIGQFHVDKH